MKSTKVRYMASKNQDLPKYSFQAYFSFFLVGTIIMFIVPVPAIIYFLHLFLENCIDHLYSEAYLRITTTGFWVFGNIFHEVNSIIGQIEVIGTLTQVEANRPYPNSFFSTRSIPTPPLWSTIIYLPTTTEYRLGLRVAGGRGNLVYSANVFNKRARIICLSMNYYERL